jgi:hypothetical protein
MFIGLRKGLIIVLYKMFFLSEGVNPLFAGLRTFFKCL